MFSRLFSILVVLFWVVSMAWLLGEKVIPPLLGGDPPDYHAALLAEQAQALPDAWRIRWKEQTIGFAASRLVTGSDGLERHSFAEFEDLPLDVLLSELLGPLSAVVKPFLDQTRGMNVDLMVATRVRFDQDRRLTGFDTTLHLLDADFLRIQGSVDENGKLSMVARMISGAGDSGGQAIRHSVQLPPEALVESSLLPRGQLKNLHVGQTWTIPVYRAFPPNSPVQILQAEVEKHDVIIWETDEVETFAIVYRLDAGSGLNATRDPVSREWVRKDGLVLRQEVSFSGLKVQFERQEDVADPRLGRLELLRERLWSD